ncbi:MAG: hypothetical protein LPK45_10355, partial [Bacteroidota bacterium]|nr:hypothetical protein [Bacteroidota bacterium]MDX5431498.1 hypothetical protein [Bacteroidota bacterium]MDX5470222.1 hypothetical protein [Bacteroidota bacterium]
TWKFMREYWSSAYFHPSIWSIWLLISAVNIYAYKKVPGIWNRIHWVLLVGCFAYLALFFRQFSDHDDYFILCYSYFVFAFLAFAINVHDLFPRIAGHRFTYLILFFMVMASFRYVAQKYHGRVDGEDAFADAVASLEGYDHVLDSLQIGKDASFIVIGDVTHNGSLYHLRRQGFAIHDSSAHEMGIMENLRPVHQYQFALSLPGFDFGSKIEAWNMQLLDERKGLRLYRIPDSY